MFLNRYFRRFGRREYLLLRNAFALDAGLPFSTHVGHNVHGYHRLAGYVFPEHAREQGTTGTNNLRAYGEYGCRVMMTVARGIMVG